jgi:prevent-host-death family protein
MIESPQNVAVAPDAPAGTTPPSDGPGQATEPLVLTWPYGYSHNNLMKTLAAGKFKDVCLQTLDEVAATRRPVVITKRGRPVARLVPIAAAKPARSLAGSVVAESGDPFSTGEVWDAGRS